MYDYIGKLKLKEVWTTNFRHSIPTGQSFHLFLKGLSPSESIEGSDSPTNNKKFNKREE